MADKKQDFLTFRELPLVRCDNTIYYGNMSDPYVVMFQITSTKDFNGLEVADRVIVQLLSTDPDASPRERIIKKTEKKGLYNAIDIGSIWLKRALNQNID
ncbi:hypothetical protein SDC9_200033 [bioreactor metagenome]|uniref:Uncharacterized protein n=1 Tax=bioreactor metagenome TaxID=1076179 RepID=A0A645INE1_9ZZZZ